MNHARNQLMLVVLLTAGVVALGAGVATAVDRADRCEAGKVKEAGKYGACRLKVEAKAVKRGEPADYAKCERRFSDRWGKIEAAGAGACPTAGDEADIQDQLTADTGWVAKRLTGQRYVDNGDGTVTDTETGLMWEKKDGLGGIHDVQNSYTWSTCPSWPDDCPPDGTAFTEFLAGLNDCESSDGDTVTGGFAGHCDWRLATVAELKTIVDCSFGNPCIDPVFGPAQATQANCYWSSTNETVAGPDRAWAVSFSSSVVCGNSKFLDFYVRAVRSVARFE